MPWRFKTRDLKKTPGNSANRYIVGAREYSENAINTIPRNHSVRPDGTDPGDYVRKGRAPAFFWHGKGEYELILNHVHYVEEVDPEDGESGLAEGDEETLIRVIPRGKPVGSTKRGWGARLDAYFWPAPDQNWHTTCSRVSSISSQIQRAIERLKTCSDDAAAADELLDAFKCACAWGSVKLPERDPRRLAGEALEAVRALSDGREHRLVAV